MGLLRVDHRTPLSYGCIRAKKAAAFQELVLHPQPGDLVFEFLPARTLHRGQGLVWLGMLAAPGVHPVPQGPVMDPQVPGHLRDRLAG
jgi:hypothetical protein